MTQPLTAYPADLPRIPPRDPAGHKGTFGTVAVVGGCALAESRMIGAPTLVALAAIRSGAGLARLFMPEPILGAGLTIAPWCTGRALPVDGDGAVIAHEAAVVIDDICRTCQCLAIGPGLGRGEGPQGATLRAIQQEDIPVVVDADAINALAGIPEGTRDLRARVVLTPHPGEFKRLVRAMGFKNDLNLAASRSDAATALAQRLGCIVVLKGAGTVVTDGQRMWVNTSGHACLAVGGTGDVLTGVIAGLIAQFVRGADLLGKPKSKAEQGGLPPSLDLFDAARLAVFVHGLAAERWARSRNANAGLLATELADELPATFALCTGDASAPDTPNPKPHTRPPLS